MTYPDFCSTINMYSELRKVEKTIFLQRSVFHVILEIPNLSNLGSYPELETSINCDRHNCHKDVYGRLANFKPIVIQHYLAHCFPA
jgi:hypothetical protein